MIQGKNFHWCINIVAKSLSQRLTNYDQACIKYFKNKYACSSGGNVLTEIKND